jgi:FkbM family methyltransferase
MIGAFLPLLKRVRRALNKYSGFAPRRTGGVALYGQGLEDLYLRRIFPPGRKGFYVDVGAHDGRFISNTYGLYREGWRGICVEPNPIAYAALRRLRPLDICLKVGVGREEGERTLGWVNGITEGSRFSPSPQGGAAQAVPVVTLDRIVREHAAPVDFDLLSVDVEGMEVEVLSGLDWMTYRPHIVIVEYNSQGDVTLDSLELLGSHGYRPILINRWNIMYSRTPAVDIVKIHRRQEWYSLDRVTF